MTVSIIPAVNEARLSGLLAYLDGGTGAAKVRIYGGTRPALATDSPGSTLLVEMPLTTPCGAVASGVLTLSPDGTAQITSSGTATWARIVRGGETTGIDADASGMAGAGDVKLSDTALWAGGFVSLVSAVLG